MNNIELEDKITELEDEINDLWKALKWTALAFIVALIIVYNLHR